MRTLRGLVPLRPSQDGPAAGRSLSFLSEPRAPSNLALDPELRAPPLFLPTSSTAERILDLRDRQRPRDLSERVRRVFFSEESATLSRRYAPTTIGMRVQETLAAIRRDASVIWPERQVYEIVGRDGEFVPDVEALLARALGLDANDPETFAALHYLADDFSQWVRSNGSSGVTLGGGRFSYKAEAIEVDLA